MIEIVSDARCTRCNLHQGVPDGRLRPSAGRRAAHHAPGRLPDLLHLRAQGPADALYVSPWRDPDPGLDEAALISSGVMGSYRARLGWGEGRTPPRTEADAFVLAGLTPPGPEPGP